MSAFQYNGIQLAHMRTLLFQIKDVKDPSGSDMIWPQYTIKVQGFLSRVIPDAVQDSGVVPDSDIGTNNGSQAQPPSPFSVLQGVPEGDTAAFIAEVKHKLKLPRRPLLYRMGPHTLIQVAPKVGEDWAVDAALGPIPFDVEVTQVNSGLFLVTWGGVVCIPDCPENPVPTVAPGTTSTRAVVSLRWSQSESFDENWYSRLTTRGRLIVRSDLRTTADSFRSLCVPNILPDYVRTTENFTLSPTGTELDFEFVDQEKNLLPPSGCTSASGRFTVVLSKQGAVRHGQVDLKLTGPKGMSRAVLMQVAIRMAFAKFAAEGWVTGEGIPPMFTGTVRENLFEPEVELSLNSLLIGRAFVDTLDIIQSAGNTPGTAPGQPGLSPPVRSRLLALLTSMFRDPCHPEGVPVLGVNAIANAELAAGGAPVAIGGPITTITMSPLPPVTGSSAVRDQAPYDSYEIESEYVYDTGRVQMPGTGVGPNGKKSAIVKAHGGMMQLEVTWHAERSGLAPVLPRLESPNSNFVALRGVTIPGGVEVTADGRNPRYTVSGCYTYAVIDPDLVNVVAPTPPFLASAIQAASKEAVAHYSDDIVWKFQGQGNPAPFVENPPIDQPPNTDVRKALGGDGEAPQLPEVSVVTGYIPALDPNR